MNLNCFTEILFQTARIQTPMKCIVLHRNYNELAIDIKMAPSISDYYNYDHSSPIKLNTGMIYITIGRSGQDIDI